MIIYFPKYILGDIIVRAAEDFYDKVKLLEQDFFFLWLRLRRLSWAAKT